MGRDDGTEGHHGFPGLPTLDGGSRYYERMRNNDSMPARCEFLCG